MRQTYDFLFLSHLSLTKPKFIYKDASTSLLLLTNKPNTSISYFFSPSLSSTTRFLSLFLSIPFLKYHSQKLHLTHTHTHAHNLTIGPPPSPRRTIAAVPAVARISLSRITPELLFPFLPLDRPKIQCYATQISERVPERRRHAARFSLEINELLSSTELAKTIQRLILHSQPASMFSSRSLKWEKNGRIKEMVIHLQLSSLDLRKAIMRMELISGGWSCGGSGGGGAAVSSYDGSVDGAVVSTSCGGGGDDTFHAVVRHLLKILIFKIFCV
ncbi:hypothetical protein ACS0TY_005042 [Phlomoides rotata]